MGEALTVFWLALGMGLVFNAAPGAVFAESLRRGVKGGFRPALDVQVGSLAGDAVWAVLGLAGAGALLTLPPVRLPVAVAGCLLLGWLGVASLRAAGRGATTAEVGAPVPARPSGRANGPDRGALATGAAMSLGNPWNVVFWSGAAGAVGAAVTGPASWPAMAVFFVGFMASSLAWCFVCAGLIAVLQRALAPALVRWVEGLCGVALLAFAVVLLWRAVQA